MVEYAFSHCASSIPMMLFNPFAQIVDVVLVKRVEIDHFRVAAVLDKVAGFVEHIGDPTAHASGKIAAGRAEDDGIATGHVFAPMVANAFDNGLHAGVADAESLAGQPTDVGFASRCAVEGDVADQDVLLRHEGSLFRRTDNQLGAGQPFAEIVVGIALDVEGDSLGTERAKALPCRPLAVDLDGVFRQAFLSVALGNFIAEHRTDGAVDIADLGIDFDRLRTAQCIL